MTADAYLPVIVERLPVRMVLRPDGMPRDKVRRAVDMGVVRVIAGPEECDVVIDVKRPYYRALCPTPQENTP